MLGIALVCAIGGLYAHRQNQETTRRRQIADARSQLEALRERNTALEEEMEARLLAPALQLSVREKELPLQKITPSRVIPAGPVLSGAAPLAHNP